MCTKRCVPLLGAHELSLLISSLSSAPHRTSTPALEAILARSGKANTPNKAVSAPSYLPNSLPALLERLATYRLATFSPSKPPSISALACALHGWIHTPTTRERVQCVTCGQGVVVLPPSAGDGAWSSPIGQRLRQEHERLVSTEGQGHAETCPWRLRPCAQSLYRLPGGGIGVQSGGRRHLLEDVARGADAMDAAGLAEMQIALPSNAAAVLGTDEGRSRLAKALAVVRDGEEAVPASSSSPSQTALLLAIFGWNLPAAPISSTSSNRAPLAAPATKQPRSRSNSSSSLASFFDPTQPVLACTYCTRNILATSYVPSTASAPATSAPKTFDVLRQHQAFCPFVDPHAGSPPQQQHDVVQKDGTRALKPGWQLRFEAIMQRPLAAESTEASAAPARGSNVSRPAFFPARRPGPLTYGFFPQPRELLFYVRKLLGPKGTPKERIALRSGTPRS